MISAIFSAEHSVVCGCEGGSSVLEHVFDVVAPPPHAGLVTPVAQDDVLVCVIEPVCPEEQLMVWVCAGSGVQLDDVDVDGFVALKLVVPTLGVAGDVARGVLVVDVVVAVLAEHTRAIAALVAGPTEP